MSVLIKKNQRTIDRTGPGADKHRSGKAEILTGNPPSSAARTRVPPIGSAWLRLCPVALSSGSTYLLQKTAAQYMVMVIAGPVRRAVKKMPPEVLKKATITQRRVKTTELESSTPLIPSLSNIRSKNRKKGISPNTDSATFPRPSREVRASPSCK